jgi:CheY-like chemotaxis protein
MKRENFLIVMADDDLDDHELMKDAFSDTNTNVKLIPVYDGIQLMDYLFRRYKYSGIKDSLPDLIFLDLNMPLMDGFEALKQIKESPSLKHIPVYVVTTSRSPESKKLALELGASGFYSKGASSSEIKKIVKEVCLECFG